MTTLNLSNVASDVDLSAVNTGGAIGTLTFGTIGASQTVTLTGDQASGKTITGTGSVLLLRVSPRPQTSEMSIPRVT